MEIFEKEPLTWSLRGDPELWQELKNRFRGFDYSVNPETFNEILTRHFNAIIEKGIKISEDTIFFETYSKKGMSGGHVSLEWWYQKGLPILRETYFKNHLGIYKENQILLQNILPLDDLIKEGKVLLIRHYHDNLKEMLESGVLEEYQSFQKMPAFRKAKYIISFTAEPNNYAKLFGVYKIGAIKEKAELPEYSVKLSKFCKKQNVESDFYMTLNRDNRFSKYEGRIIIDWIVPRGWYNTYGEVKDKPVMKITPRNFVDEFPGLMKINISAFDLRKIIENPETHSSWRDSLTRLQAVYLIMDNQTGNLYVGTTFGKDGLWQRWESYVKSGFTGGNAKLENLKGKNGDFYIGFQYSILEVLPKNATQKDCNSAESLWKEKLGTRAFGLNMN
jgi:hypothetical protein